MLVAGINYLYRKAMISRNHVNTVAAALIYRKKLHILLFMTILCQGVFIFPDLEYPSFYLPNALAQEDQAEPVACITYDSEENIIKIDCEHANLTDIDNQLKDPDLLNKETENGVWLLKAGVVVGLS
jgi:hypothetical protein